MYKELTDADIRPFAEYLHKFLESKGYTDVNNQLENWLGAKHFLATAVALAEHRRSLKKKHMEED